MSKSLGKHKSVFAECRLQFSLHQGCSTQCMGDYTLLF